MMLSICEFSVRVNDRSLDGLKLVWEMVTVLAIGQELCADEIIIAERPILEIRECHRPLRHVPFIERV